MVAGHCWNRLYDPLFMAGPGVNPMLVILHSLIRMRFENIKSWFFLYVIKVFYDDCRCSPSLTTLPTESELTSSTWTGSLERPEVPPPHPLQTSLRPSEEAHSQGFQFVHRKQLCAKTKKRSFPLKPGLASGGPYTQMRKKTSLKKILIMLPVPLLTFTWNAHKRTYTPSIITFVNIFNFFEDSTLKK